ncbi:MAG TPA: Fic family protein [Arachnia sp.]|nr:Fic family protein [Arachnia sp.]HMT86554.1 Fic family protein [Arachnia sp.]
MAEEYLINARAFAEALREQRAMKLKGGLYHLNQIQMAYNTNRIEGSRLTEAQTRYIYETRTVLGDALVDDVIEMANHFRIFDAMLDRVGEPLTAEVLKDYHSVLKTGTADAEKSWFAGGDWKRVENEVGGRRTTSPANVARAMDDLLAATPSEMAFEDICDFHHRFESIHPFQDGNGRVGRLIMFGQCLANGIMPFIVTDEEKAFYYRGLAEYDETPGYLQDTFRHFQDLYYERYRPFLP